MKNFLQVIRALAAKKNSRLVIRALAAEKNSRLVNRALAAEKNSRLVNRALAAEKNVFTLNSLSNPDGQPTVKRQSAVALQSGTRSEKAPLSPSCLKCASYMPPTCPRPDSLSLVSRQSDLDQVRAVSVGLSTRVWKHVAMIFAVLVLSMANIGMAWGAPTQSYVLTGSSSTIANGKTDNIGGAYCGRKGSSITLNATYGLPSGGGNSAAVFVVNQASNITFILDNRQASAKSGNVLLASVSDSYYTDCQNGTLGNLPSTASQTKAVSFAKNADSGENEFTFESSVSAGKYVVYWTSGINASIYLKRIEINATGSCTNVGISTQPTSPVAATVGSACSITGLVASGTSPSYQWYTCNSDGSSATAITAAGSLSFTGYKTATLGLTPTAAGTTYYKCVVSGSCGDPVTSNVVAVNATAQYTVTYNLNGGKYNGSSDAPTQAAVESGTSITMPVLAPTKSGYAFTGWRCSVNSADYMPSASYTMTAANTTFTAQWTEACFEVPDARKNSNPAATITASMLKGNKIAGGTLTWESANDYSGNADHGLILNEDGEQIVVTLSEGTFVAGSIITITTHGNSGTSKTCGVKVSGNNMTPATYSTSTAYLPFTQTYVVKAGDGIVGTNTFAIKRYNSNKVYIYSITVSGCGAASCTAPNHVDISGNYHFFPGETLALTATAYSTEGTSNPIAAGDITGYQWQKYIVSDWEDIVGETSATYTKANATTSDVGQYRCIVSTGATCSTTSGTFNAKCLQLYVYWDNKSDKCNLPFTKVDGTHATVNVSLENGSYTYYYKVTDGCGNWWGNDGTMTSSNCSGWNLNVNNHCGLTTTKAAAYTFNLTYNAGVDVFSMSVVYPSTVQTGGYNLYFANDERNWSNIHYRIGRNNWNSKAAMTLVPGTANLYQTTTIHYESDGGFEAWHIANNGGWSNGNSIYKTKTGDGNAITNATRFEGAPVPSTGLTVIPGSDHSTGGEDQNNNCEFYSYTTVPGMWTHNVSITPPSYGTLTVNYTTISNEPAAFNSGNRDLAHTANYCVTAEEGTGYTVASITINGTPVENRSWHVLREDVVVAATFSPASYTVTLNTNGGTINAGNVASYTYGTGATLPTNVTKDGFTFGGWYDNSGLTGSAVTTISTTATGNKEYWAKWTEAASLTALECDTLYKVADMVPASITLTGEGQYGAGLSANTKFEVLGDPSKTDQAGGAPEMKNEEATINTIVFPARMYLKRASNLSEGIPTSHAVKFIVGESGVLDVYAHRLDRIYLKKAGGDATQFGTSTSTTPTMVTFNVTAGTYYIYSTGGSTCVYGVRLNCCTTPAAPTAFSNTAVTSTTATFSITDAGDAASYEIYTSTSSSTPTSETGTSVNSKTPTITGLTANTTYYAWVRSVCDADHKSAWVALGTTSFTTAAAEPTALVTWQMKVDQAAWALKSGTTEDGTNITSIASTADEPGSTSTGITGTTGKVVMASGESNVDKAASFTFTINSAKKVVPEKVTCKVLNVSSGNRTYKAQLSDNNGHVYYSTNTVSVTTENVLTDATFNFASSLVLTGNVTLKVYAWKTSGSPTQFRMGEYVKLFGEVDDYSCTALNLTRGGQENGTYTVGNYTGNPLTCTVNAGEPASYQWKQYTLGQGMGEAVNAVGSGSTTTSFTPNPASANTYYYACEVTDICGNTLITPYTGTFVFNTAATYSVTHSLTNVTATSGATGASAATEGVAYNAAFAASSGYVLPSTITVTIGGSPATVGTGYTWNASTGAFQVPAAQVTGDIVVTIAADVAPATKDIYYGQVAIADGALVREITNGTIQFFTNIGGTVANTTEISLTSTPSTGGIYYNSNNLTDAELSKSSNWNTSSGSNRYIRGLKFANGTTYTLALGTKVASTITFYGWCGSSSKTMTVGGEEFTSSATKNTFAKHEFIKTGGFTGNVSITQDGGDFYGILVITIQTATPCTTPVIPTLSNQSLCEGTDIAEWNATVTNASAISAADETVTYSWKKKGNDTELANTATFDLGSSAAESQAGTYVVTVTVSKTGYASSTATKEVTLSVTDGVEVTAITADKATVYPTNSVTLTATASADATWQWYTCTNAEGAGESSIGGATNAAYAFTAPASAGTYYYKVKATSACGNAERVYTLVVTAASECENYFWFVYAADATTNGVVNNRDGFFTSAPTGSSNSSTYKFTLDGTEYKATKNTGSGSFSISFTIPAGSTATMGINCKGSSSKPLYLTHSSGTPQKLVSNSSSNASCTVEDITEGTWTLTSAGSWTLAALGVQVCTTSTCTDATPTIAAANTTVCVGGELSITATGYETSPESIQWQKLNGSAWDNISGATAATYTVASATAADAGSYRVVVTKGCARTSNTVTIAVPSAPVFADFTATRSVMATLALSITDVEASDATAYAWYKSADATYDAGTDTKVGTTQELLLASGGEAAGATYYLFCVASNACGSTTSSAITVNVTDLVEEDCATKGNEGAADFGFTKESGVGESSVSSQSCWTSGGKAKYLTYTAPDGKYFDNAKVTVAVSSGSVAAYGYSTDGSSYTYANLTGLSSALAEKTIEDLPANVTHFRIGRNFDPSYGVTSGTFYLSKICFEYADACTATTVTPNATSKTHTIGESFTAPTFTLAPAAVSSGTLTYSSSDEDIASVDESGNVTFNGTAGTVTITAAYAGATIADVDYCASEGSYTITVSCEGGAPKIVVTDGSVNMSGCNSSVTLNAKTQADGDFADGTYQWFRNGTEIDGATSSSYTATQAGTYTVARTSTSGCTSLSTNSATVTSESAEPEVTKLVPFQYYHVDKTYSAQMKDRHLFSVKGSAAYGSTGKNFKLELSRNGGAATDITTTASISVIKSADNTVDTVMIDLNKLSGKYSEGDELVVTCKAVDCGGAVSDTYKDNITIHVIGATPTLALICSGTDIAAGTRETKKLKVGGDFLTGYNVADLCQQTGNTTFDANTEWGLYTRLKENYIVTPVNGYAVFNKLNYEPFDILLLTDYPKASKSDAAKDVLDDMADLCDYRPMLSFKTHMVAKSPSKWAAKGFTTSATENKADGRLNLNIVCYAHPMFESIKTGENVYDDVANSSAPLVYTMLTGVGHEGSKGMQGFELAAAENFVTIGLTHYNATIAKNSPSAGQVTWTPGTEDRMLVTVAERQTNIEARFILFSLNCGAQSMLTEKGRTVVLACLSYLLETDPLKVADCSFTFDNGEGNKRTPEEQATNCPSCPAAGDGKWSNPANWGPDYRLLPGEFTSVRIKKPVEVDITNAHVMEARIIEEGQITIPASKALEVKSTIRRMEGTEIYPTEANDIVIGSNADGNGSLIFNNNAGDTKARVALYSTAQADVANMSAATSTWQYIGTPHNDVASATRNYYGSWLYQYDTESQGWTVIKNGGPLVPFRGYCVTHPSAPVVFDMSGTLAATTSADIDVPANKYVVTANSWVAPIDINKITDDDMEGISDKAIYFFNTGSDVNGTGTINGGDRWAAGTYVSVPIHSAPYTGDDHIPSMQGFYVWSTTDGTLHLDYDRHVRGQGRGTIVSGRMHAPKRVQTGDNEPEVLKIIARGNRYDDRLIVLEREDFTRRYESGWDGEAWGGSDLSPMVYITNEAGVDEAVSAIPEFEGTQITFRAGEDSEYRFEFTYSEEAEPLYLLDTDNNTYTQVVTGNEYYFTTYDKSPHKRFVLTRKAPQIATGVDQVSSDQVSSTKARKLLIEDKMYILLNGMLYDATGKAVQ